MLVLPHSIFRHFSYHEKSFSGYSKQYLQFQDKSDEESTQANLQLSRATCSSRLQIAQSKLPIQIPTLRQSLQSCTEKNIRFNCKTSSQNANKNYFVGEIRATFKMSQEMRLAQETFPVILFYTCRANRPKIHVHCTVAPNRVETHCRERKQPHVKFHQIYFSNFAFIYCAEFFV